MNAIYIKTKFNNTINISKIVTVHYYEFDKNFSYDGETHDFWEMVYVDKGKVAVKSGDSELILGQEQIIFHKPNEFHAIKAHASSPDFFVVSFVCNSQAMKRFNFFHTTLDKTLKPILASIIYEAEKTYVIKKNDVELTKLSLREDAPIGGEQLVKTYLEQLLIMLLRQISDKSATEIFPSKENLENDIVRTIKNYINDNVREKITLPKICNSLGYGKSYLCKVFKELSGNSICGYANDKKIEYAKRLVRDDNMNFSEISDYLSFDNPQYFSRVFKRITGMTPSEFKLRLHI